MSPKYSETKLEDKFEELVLKFIADIRNGKLEGSDKIALATVTIFEKIINESQNATAYELITSIKSAGNQMTRALPQELVIANMTRRVLRAIRSEHRMLSDTSTTGAVEGDSLQRIVLGATARRGTLGANAKDLREPLREHMAELRLELEGSWSSICEVATDHIHADECILTGGNVSRTEKFLKAARSRKYRLVVAEGPAPYQQSHATAARLATAGIPVTLINDSCIFAVMSRINKVVLAASAVLAGGAVLCAAGTKALTTAAQHWSVPVIVLAPLYKLSPLHASEQHRFNALTGPQNALSYESIQSNSCQVIAPAYDYIPADHVTLFITNLGGSSPSYIYRHISELYDPNDYDI